MSPPIAPILEEILGLQPAYSSENTDAMKRRGVLVRRGGPDAIREKLELIGPVFGRAGFECSVEGSDGVGLKNESAWIRLFDPSMSPSATRGWYVVTHFSRDGRRIYSALQCGSTIFAGGSFVPVADADLRRQVEWARNVVAGQATTAAGYLSTIELNGNRLSRQFEKATALARMYETGFSEGRFWSELRELCELLVRIYHADRLGKGPLSLPPELVEAQQAIDRISRPRAAAGQGRGLTPRERRAVERRAMAVVARALEIDGFSDVVDVSARESYDIRARRDGIVWLVEVKGTTGGSASTFLLTAAELKLHRANPDATILAIVSNIELSGDRENPIADRGVLELHHPWDPEKWNFLPTAYQAVRRD